MSSKPEPGVNDSLQVDRRGFLAGVGVVLTGLPLQTFAATPTVAAVQQSEAKRALYQQMPYFSFEAGAESYVKPAASKTTHNYVASLSEEEFLRRHWFS